MTVPQMHARAFVPTECWQNPEVELGVEESHHLLHVLRVREGCPVGILNGRGGTGMADVVAVRKKRVTLAIRERRETKPPSVQITLLQSLPREQHMDAIVQKATELGVSTVVPLQAAHSVVKLDAAKAVQRRERWERIALGAIKQSGNPWLPSIEAPCVLDEWLTRASRPSWLLVGALREGAKPLREVLRRPPVTRPLQVGVFIGPEGDFTDEEMDRIMGCGAKPVTFGDTVLRVETAAVFILSALRYEFFQAG